AGVGKDGTALDRLPFRRLLAFVGPGGRPFRRRRCRIGRTRVRHLRPACGGEARNQSGEQQQLCHDRVLLCLRPQRCAAKKVAHPPRRADVASARLPCDVPPPRWTCQCFIVLISVPSLRSATSRARSTAPPSTVTMPNSPLRLSSSPTRALTRS